MKRVIFWLILIILLIYAIHEVAIAKPKKSGGNAYSCEQLEKDNKIVGGCRIYKSCQELAMSQNVKTGDKPVDCVYKGASY